MPPEPARLSATSSADASRSDAEARGSGDLASRLTLDELQLEVALYIESLSAELRMMARDSKLDSLAYFLEMARIEASIQVERHAGSMPLLPAADTANTTKY